ncbi:cell envelope integrity protein TolA [Oxalobacteraceae bacterium CAVE-383]|nr:cell envelope integrity protein TolA [Oxalobacteraceae bacterium CAVE-383]
MAEVSNRPPQPRGAWRSLALALIMHIALFAFLWIGVRWQNDTPLVVEAEIWDPQIKEAAPLPEPVPPPPPTPVPAPEPVKPPPPPKIEEPVVAKPDIALEKEKEKKRKEQEQKDLAKAKEKEQELEKQRKKLADQQQKDKEQKLEKQKADEAAKKKEDADKLADDKRRKQTEADKKAAEKRRQDDLKLMHSQFGGTGDAPKSQGPRGNPAYASKVGARIKANTVFNVPADLAGNPAVEYDVQLLPDGSVSGIRLTKPSGVPGFDDAVKAAIMKSAPYPKDVDGTVPGSFSLSHKPKDQ